MKRHLLHLLQAVFVVCVLCITEVLSSLPAIAKGIDLLVIDFGNNRVLHYDGATGMFIDELIPAGSGGLEAPQDITIGPDGNLYVSSWATGSVKRYERTTGAFLGDFIPSGSGGLANPDQLIFGPDGRLYVSDRFSGRVLRYDGLTGASLGTFVQDNRLFGFVAFTFGPDGHLYASMFNGIQCILRYDGQTGAFLDEFACAPDSSSAFSGLAFGPDGHLYASRYHLGEVWQLDGSSGQLLGVLHCDGDTRADYLAFGPDDRLYVSNLVGSNLSRFNVHSGQCLGEFLKGDAINGSKGFVFVSTITCPADIAANNDPGQCSAVVNYPAPLMSGGSGNVVVVCNPLSGSAFPVGTTTVNCTATDEAGNIATCSFTVTVNDKELPVASCAVVKATVLVSNPPRIVGWFQLLATDNCDPDPLIYIKGSVGSFVAGPFHNGDQVEIAHGPTLIPRQSPHTSGGNIATIQLNGDALMWAVDSSGNASTPIKCK